jgi:hypothetical protein
MTIPTGDNDFLYELKLNVREELTVAESSPLGEESDGAPNVQWLLDPDAQRYEVILRNLLGAVEAAEDDSP